MQNIKVYGIFLLGFLAAIVATICDGIHVYTQTLSYPYPLIFNQAWWVFPGFFLAFISMAIAYLILSHLFKNTIPIKLSSQYGTSGELVETLTTFAIIYILSGFGNFHPTALCIIFYSTFALRFLFSYERYWLLIIAILLAMGGVLFEGLLAEFGQVKYRHSDIFNVPYWLGGVYMHGAFALRSGMRALVYSR